MATQLEFFAEISKGPQTRRLELSSGSGEWGIPQETPVDETKRRAGLRREAHERLAYLQRSSVDDRAQIYQHILGPYGYSETEIAELSNLQSCALALTHLNQDWLLEEFISPDGSPSPFADQYYPQVDPEQYQYFGLRGGEAKKM
ncbi:MAG: hypothetical protein Q7S31_01520, partial [bacterium]|nr:hypothetical protein [bacterium]